MGKTVLAAVFIMVSFALAHAQQITVISPAAGNNWHQLSTYTITWTKSGAMQATAAIRLRRAGSPESEAATVQIVDGTANDGSFSWTVPDTVAPGNYFIRVRTDDSTVIGDSGIFSIALPLARSLSIEIPHGGESWEIGSTKAVAWLASNIEENCRLVLLKGNLVVGTIRDSFPPGQGGHAWNWKVGDYLGGGPAPTGNDYHIRIETVSGNFPSMPSGPFTIAPLPLVFHPLDPKPGFNILLRPDLMPCLAWGGKRPYLLEDWKVTIRVKNIGKAASAATTLQLYVEGKGTYSVQVPALAINAEFSFQNEYSWGTLGHKTVRVTVDPNGQVTESNENNNMISGSIAVISVFQDRFVAETNRCADPN